MRYIIKQNAAIFKDDATAKDYVGRPVQKKAGVLEAGTVVTTSSEKRDPFTNEMFLVLCDGTYFSKGKAEVFTGEEKADEGCPKPLEKNQMKVFLVLGVVILGIFLIKEFIQSKKEII